MLHKKDSSYDLYLKCPAQAHVLNPWSSDGGAILGGDRNVRRLGLVRGSRSLGVFL